MTDPRIPSTFNYVQSVLWIAISIDKHISKERLLDEVQRFTSINSKVEPPLSLIIRDLKVSYFELPEDLRPDTSVEVSIIKAHDQLLDALRSGQVTMRGRKMGNPEIGVQALSQSDCEQVMIREGNDWRQRAVIADFDGLFWDMLRFSSSEIMTKWPVEEETETQREALSPEPNRGEAERRTPGISDEEVVTFSQRNIGQSTLNTFIAKQTCRLTEAEAWSIFKEYFSPLHVPRGMIRDAMISRPNELKYPSGKNPKMFKSPP